jgi:chemotaxis protein CheC
MERDLPMLTPAELQTMTILFRRGAADASVALTRWLGHPAEISVEQIEPLPTSEATRVLGDAPICFCSMAMRGKVTGQLILSFDDPSGLALADLLLSQPVGISRDWGEVEQSAALETANIIGCAYLNSLFRFAANDSDSSGEWIHTPPRFNRDFAESLMEFALMDQAMALELVFLTRTQFRIDGSPVNCSLLFIPDAASMESLRAMLVV